MRLSRRASARGLDPRTRLSLTACVGVFALLLDRPASLVALAGLSLLPLVVVDVDRTWLKRALFAALALTWANMVSQGLFYSMWPRSPLFAVGPVVVYREGLLYGMVQSLRFVAVAGAGLLLVATTPADRLLAALVALRVPFGLAFLGVTALRFLPETSREALIVRDARARRGRPLFERTPRAWLELELALLRPVVARCLRRARVLAESLDARGFDPVAPRSCRRPLELRPRDVGIIAVSGSLVLAATVAQSLFALYTADLLWFPRWAGLYAFVRGWM